MPRIVIVEPDAQSAQYLTRILAELEIQEEGGVLVVGKMDDGIQGDMKAVRFVCLGEESGLSSDKGRVVSYFEKPYRLGALADLIIKSARAAEGLPQDLQLGAYILKTHENLLSGAGADIKLTDKERQILTLLYGAGQHGLGRQELLEKVWGYGDNIETHTLETHIYRLRQKIEANPASPSFLVTRGDGYALAF